MVTPRTYRYHLLNTIGNLADRAVTFASLVFGGVMDQCPNLKVCLAHGGGYVCFGIGRMDRGWQVRSEARVHIQQPPSAYVKRFYYDCLTHSEPALRMLIDPVGVDRIVFGTDWPADMCSRLACLLGPEPAELDPGREGDDSSQKSGKTARPLARVVRQGPGAFRRTVPVCAAKSLTRAPEDSRARVRRSSTWRAVTS